MTAVHIAPRRPSPGGHHIHIAYPARARPVDAHTGQIHGQLSRGMRKLAERQRNCTGMHNCEIAPPHTLTDEQFAALAWECAQALVSKYNSFERE